jgi:hypothetical protein
MRPLRWLQALLDSDFKLRRKGHRLCIVVERPGGLKCAGHEISQAPWMVPGSGRPG